MTFGMRRGAFVWALALVAALQTAWLLYPTVRRLILSLEETPATRGHRLAAELGCFACHGPEGGGGTKNPGSQEGEVPAFTEQTQMMYVKTTDDLREYILDGAPKRRARTRLRHAHGRRGAPHARVSRLPLVVAGRRPGRVPPRGVGQIIPAQDEAEVARGGSSRSNITAFCHGPFGAGGVPNPARSRASRASGARTTRSRARRRRAPPWIADGERTASPRSDRRLVLPPPGHEDAGLRQVPLPEDIAAIGVREVAPRRRGGGKPK
jgi:hypothetical protein